MREANQMCKTLVVMIHGLTGGDETWVNNESGASFSKLLQADSKISDQIDVIEFDYFTEIVNLTQNLLVSSFVGLINKFPGVNFNKPKIRKNSSIDSLTNSLATFLEVESTNYDSIVFICHSMGGLIGKSFILNHIAKEYEDIQIPVIGYISLATPHRGSFPAVILGPVNVNAKELQPLNEGMTKLNDLWIDLFDDLPKSYYVEALHDECVGKLSATPNTVKKFRSKTLQVSHSEICKPLDSKDLTYKVVSKYLEEILHTHRQKKLTQVEYESDVHSYDKEIFVIKMVLASIEAKLIEDAKESFFHAELIMKSAKKHELENFKELRTKIISLYRTYSSCKGSKSNSEVVKDIHSKIVELDKSSLDCLVEYLNFLHKKGILHQEANRLNLDVNWCDTVTIDSIENEVR
ncbi:ABC-three component system protein [Shewanella baltica]|uniref:ABC-three component system protein n=1 Tax=Shewanella baltica TaxID=62322 RepID=UPI0039B02337